MGLALARSSLARLEAGGVEYLLDPRTPDLLDAHRGHARGVFLLPGFDEFVLGYADRRAVSTSHSRAIRWDEWTCCDQT